MEAVRRFGVPSGCLLLCLPWAGSICLLLLLLLCCLSGDTGQGSVCTTPVAVAACLPAAQLHPAWKPGNITRHSTCDSCRLLALSCSTLGPSCCIAAPAGWPAAGRPALPAAMRSMPCRGCALHIVSPPFCRPDSPHFVSLPVFPCPPACLPSYHPPPPPRCLP